MNTIDTGETTRRGFVSTAVVGAAASTLLSSAGSAEAAPASADLSKRKPAEPLIVLVVRFKPKAGRTEEFRRHLYDLVEAMKVEKAWVNTTVHQDLDHEGEIVLYETWRGTRESWVAEEFPRPYRAPYEAIVKDMLEDRQVSWLVPTDIWGARQ